MGKPRVRTSVVCVHNRKLLCFLAEDPSTKELYHFLPGGKIESHETAPEAGERETFEETGFRIEVDPGSGVDREYQFSWDGQDYDCLTLFYRARLLSPLQTPVSDSSYHRGVVWVDVDRVPEVFSYSDDIRDAILELIKPFTEEA